MEEWDPKTVELGDITMQVEEVAEVKYVHFEELENHFRHETMDFSFYPDFYRHEINLLFDKIKSALPLTKTQF